MGLTLIPTKSYQGSNLVSLGGLGKVPGFYYVQQNRENLSRLRRELRTAVRRAMQASQKTLRDMSARAMESSFPLIEWQAQGGLAVAISAVGKELEFSTCNPNKFRI